MTEFEVADPAQARQIILTGLCFARTRRLAPSHVKGPLSWALELCSEGHPLPPIGFVADLGQIMLGVDRENRPTTLHLNLPSWEATLRVYEDHVLGKIYADRSVDRAADVLRRLHGRDQARGLAFVIEQMRTRLCFPGIHMSPAVLKALLDLPGEEIVSQSRALMAGDTLDPLLEPIYNALIGSFRQAADLLAAEDVFELEHGTALAEFGQRVALRQVIQAINLLMDHVPKQSPPVALPRREVPTALLDEDAYPVGGFASISNRGSIESLLHSQLALMESDSAHRPDMFDIKFLRDELLYFSRDENQFLRRHRRFAIELDGSLTTARFKETAAPFQRIIFTLAAAIVIIRMAQKRLDRDELLFQVICAAELADEMKLLQAILRDDIQAGLVAIAGPDARKTNQPIDSLVVEFTNRPNPKPEAIQIDVSSLQVSGIDRTASTLRDNDIFEKWSHLISHVLAAWTRDS